MSIQDDIFDIEDALMDTTELLKAFGRVVRAFGRLETEVEGLREYKNTLEKALKLLDFSV